VAVLFVLIVSVGLAAAIWWLRRNQQRQRSELVELSSELPPLTPSNIPDFAKAASSTPFPIAPPMPSKPTPSNATPAATATEEKSEKTVSLAWLDLVKKLKERQELETALTLCQQQFPKSQAFQQATIIIRMQIKLGLEKQQDVNPLITKLYRCAVFADLFHNPLSLKPQNPRLAMTNLAGHEFSYAEIGHHELKLLSKSDVRLLEERWGLPQQHSRPEAILGNVWQTLCQ
jgi:hypothetical protein